MKILAFAASSSRSSINKALVTHAAQRLVGEFLPDATIELLDLNDYEPPLYSIDRERADGIPEPARQFLAKISEADALLISHAEHNGSYTAAYKSLFDWMSRIEQKVFAGKPMVLLATSPGGRGGQRVLQTAVELAPRFGGEVVASLSVPRFHDAFDREAGALTDPDLAAQLGRALELLARRLDPSPPGLAM